MNKKEYLFALLAEESCEVAQAANKCIRFTPEHAYYDDSNLERLQTEITDFMTVLQLLAEELGTVFSTEISAAKVDRIEGYMTISRNMGTLV